MLSNESWQNEDDNGQIDLSDAGLGVEHTDEDKEDGNCDAQWDKCNETNGDYTLSELRMMESLRVRLLCNSPLHTTSGAALQRSSQLNKLQVRGELNLEERVM